MTNADAIAWVERLRAEVRQTRLAIWDMRYPPGHADREATRPRGITDDTSGTDGASGARPLARPRRG